MIELVKGWRIDNSNLPELVLQKEKKINVMKDRELTGDTRTEWINVGYYATLKGVFTGFMNHYAPQVDSLQEIVERIDDVKAMFDDVFTVGRR